LLRLPGIMERETALMPMPVLSGAWHRSTAGGGSSEITAVGTGGARLS
jgi:hypothetical protein